MAKPDVPTPEEVLNSLRDQGPMTARMVILIMIERNLTLPVIAHDSGVSASVLRRHVLDDFPIRAETARKLDEWSKGVISSVKMLEEKDIA